MLQLTPLDPVTPIFQQLSTNASPVVPVNIFHVAEADIPVLLNTWEADANWMKQQPGYISTQLHRGIGGSTVFMNYACGSQWRTFGRRVPTPSSRRPLSPIRLQLWRHHTFSRGSRCRICALVLRSAV